MVFPFKLESAPSNLSGVVTYAISPLMDRKPLEHAEDNKWHKRQAWMKAARARDTLRVELLYASKAALPKARARIVRQANMQYAREEGFHNSRALIARAHDRGRRRGYLPPMAR